MAKKLNTTSHRIDVSQQVEADKTGRVRPVSKRLPVKAAVIREASDEEED